MRKEREVREMEKGKKGRNVGRNKEVEATVDNEEVERKGKIARTNQLRRKGKGVRECGEREGRWRWRKEGKVEKPKERRKKKKRRGRRWKRGRKEEEKAGTNQ